MKDVSTSVSQKQRANLDRFKPSHLADSKGSEIRKIGTGSPSGATNSPPGAFFHHGCTQVPRSRQSHWTTHAMVRLLERGEAMLLGRT